jgi:hypothetical protein
MFDYLRRLAALVMRRPSPFHPFNPPSDPYAAVREPRVVKPSGRSSAVALSEPEPQGDVKAVARNRTIALALFASGVLLTSHGHAQNASQRSEKPFVADGRIEMQLSGGDYQIRAGADNNIRVSLTGNPATTKVDITTSGSQATVKVTETPHNNFAAAIEVPKTANLVVHLAAGDLTITGIAGNKDIDSYAGNVTIAIGRPDEYASVDASVKVGDLHAEPFGAVKSGMLQTFKWSGKGKYTLRAWLGAGNLQLTAK